MRTSHSTSDSVRPQSDQRAAYIVTHSEPGFPTLYQHIHLHQQATDAINFKITPWLLLEANDKIADNLKETFLQQQLYLICNLVKQVNLRHVAFCVHTAESLHNIRSSS